MSHKYHFVAPLCIALACFFIDYRQKNGSVVQTGSPLDPGLTFASFNRQNPRPTRTTFFNPPSTAETKSISWLMLRFSLYLFTCGVGW
jgi:hypothetical protein